MTPPHFLPDPIPQGPPSSWFLVASPYESPEHLLDLRTLNRENQLLAQALARLQAVRADYATAGYIESFNWGEVMAELKSIVKEQDHLWVDTSFYIVAFRSRIPPTTVYAELGRLDEGAHREAVASGGLLK